MDNGSKPTRTLSIWKKIGLALILVVGVAAYLLYQNFNRLLSDALLKTFNSHVASDVYELKFENLRVNLFEGSIRVFGASFQPREEPLIDYPYINSSIALKTDEIDLENVEIWKLLESNSLDLERISITRPSIDLLVGGISHIFLPFTDSATAANPGTTRKKVITNFLLKAFELTEATIHVKNFEKEREFQIGNFGFSLDSLLIHQHPGGDDISLRHGSLSVGSFDARFHHGPFRHAQFKDLKVDVHLVKVHAEPDTVTHIYNDVSLAVSDLDIQTADSLFHIGVRSFGISYKEKSVQIQGFEFKPNVSHAVLQRKHKFQHTDFAASVQSLELRQVNFDSLVYAKKLFIDEVIIEKAELSLYKDRTKPIDMNRKPAYLGQAVRAFKLPLRIKKVSATKVQLVNVERKPDSTEAEVRLTRATVAVNNITNQSMKGKLHIDADASLQDKMHFRASLAFDYRKPQFSFEGVVGKFNLPDINPVIQAYAPAKINKGTADEITFSGVAELTRSSGRMRFLYHDLEVDLNLKDKAKWKSAVLAFAANTIVDSSNPGYADWPVREVTFHADRDMNKSFVNLLIKSILHGVKETMIMGKENRKAYKEAKRKAK